MKRNIFVTGAAGFIGFHLCKELLEQGSAVFGLDNLNRYYDPALKESRLAILARYPGFRFIKGDLEDRDGIRAIVREGGYDTVIHLAAQAGVRYSLTNPEAYISSNLVGFFHVIDACKEFGVPHFVYASSSSVYGANEKLPFSEADPAERPVSLYAATKKSNELVAYSYSHMFGLKTTGFRFFTVYGPYGRPDMALFVFVKRILEGKPIEVNNYGDMQRDFTYVDDVTAGIMALMERSAALTADGVPYRIYNIGNAAPVGLLEFIRAIEEELGKRAEITYMPLPAGDVKATFADTSDIRRDTGFAPHTDLRDGVKRFVAWYRAYYGV